MLSLKQGNENLHRLYSKQILLKYYLSGIYPVDLLY